MTATVPERRRWAALYVLCLGVLMIVLDTTIVNVALPSIRADLGFTAASLSWVMNAYMLTFGGFLLLGGRLGDLYGHRRVFLLGTTLFTLTSLGCGLATTQALLVAARAVQGLGGAVMAAVALSLIVSLFSTPRDRARALAIYGFVCAGGGSIGVLLGGLLTSALSWHWVFLVNLPVGVLVFALCRRLVPPGHSSAGRPHLDVGGAFTITAALMLAVYAVVNTNTAGWTSARTLVQLAGAAVLFALFLTLELRSPAPLVPLRLFRLRNLAVANLIGVLWAAGMFAWFFMSALYMQLLLGYDALQVGLAFLPANLIMAAFSLGLSARVVMRFGLRVPIVVGLLLAAGGSHCSRARRSPARSSPTCCRRWCCSGWVRASASIRCCSPPWAMSAMRSRASPQASSTPRSCSGGPSGSRPSQVSPQPAAPQRSSPPGRRMRRHSRPVFSSPFSLARRSPQWRRSWAARCCGPRAQPRERRAGAPRIPPPRSAGGYSTVTLLARLRG